ncbi:flagellar biosynthetic protein FliR [Vallitalea okinawensis]|uniref:flagellar biosynthetic protein FliR n=1 Tax=Vallitalea okinawensis TaxID=2078660 RepID=UPI000CFAF666|nr:flagellar biosynthetic protein FliR [Vallitalea okinawensis]
MDQMVDLTIFLLILVRFSSFIMLAPLYGGSNVPPYVKVALAFYLSLLAYFTLPSDYTVVFQTDFEYAIIILKEFMTGAALGFTVYLVFTCLYLAGQIVDFNLGFSMVNVLDPVAKIQVPLMGNFYYLLLLTVMLVINAHLYLIEGMVFSLQALPLGEAGITSGLFTTLVEFFTTMFILAVKIASPILVCMFIVNVALGILVRAVPQMNMFVVGLPIKLILGLIILLITSPIIINIADYLYTMMNDAFFNVLEGLIQ